MSRPTATRRRRGTTLLALALAGAVAGVLPAGAQAADRGDTADAAAPRTTASGTLRVAHANLKFKMSGAQFAADLAQVVSSRPDVVSLNEVSRRTPAQLATRGYASFMPREKGNGNAVLWRTDRFTRVAGGYRVLVEKGPLKYDANRLATWAVLRSTTGGEVSLVSTHHMQNPAKFGPDKPLRQRLYAQGMQRIDALVTELSRRGPVFVAGDFNSQFRHDDAWGPRRTLAPAGLVSAMETRGVVPTHDGGGVIDYVFAPRATTTATAQRVTSLRSDHKLIVNDFRFAAPTTRGR
ncbi:endonuclease/exonuclease/phosphatase family protein [Nocardioides aurantiacus]|uniref:Endonuclease/exonuclease/phosphatase (EEP) superfamily protein YafD n=1 Tax=Nocardioides aurantiacus TaxID=86796 RepID=A0A3N2CU73_9ACTN|nr:endonuclease/exonuclease/phosphatase family protein [Nocardioides aurantiacus]ROR90754.1 endonuclease/exonuclease/phosphatase (EEP) superfamily protein YafD [Nocardioides aurantiacus]